MEGGIIQEYHCNIRRSIPKKGENVILQVVLLDFTENGIPKTTVETTEIVWCRLCEPSAASRFYGGDGSAMVFVGDDAHIVPLQEPPRLYGVGCANRLPLRGLGR